MMNHTILCVDDEIDNVDALERLFRKKYKVLKATSGAQALTILDQNPGLISVILTDQRMPLMTGAEMLEKSIHTAPKASRLLLTGYTDLESVIEAVNKGQIHRYLTKPWDPIDLQQTVDQAVEKFELSQALEKKNKELEHALNELKTIDQTKTQFMLLINHELKTPLTSIVSFLELLKESPLNEEQQLYVQRIAKSSDRLRLLIEDVLLIMRCETNQIRVLNADIRLAHVAQEIPQSLQEQLIKKQQKISLQLEVEQIHIDSFIIHEVFNRLIQNANKFGSEKSVIEIRSRFLNEKTQIEVLNRGSQFDMNKVQKFAQPFFLDESVMHHSSGTGLGLSICQSLLKIYNSTLEFENSPNGEAAVRFSIKHPS